MTNAKHTSGPWTYKAGDSVLYIHARGVIATVGTSGYWEKYSPTDEANASLIAAAPDLLAALRPFAEKPDDWTVETVNAAIAAIAKAEGRE